jgi:hypothetical protein
MNIKTSHIAIVGLLLIALANGENIRNATAKTAATKGRKDTHKEHVKKEKERSQNASDLSKVALDRYRDKCILVVDGGTKKEGYFIPGSPVIDTALNRPVREGAPICNKLGDTAIVTNSAIEDIASITADDMDAFTAILEARGYKAIQTQPKSKSK